MDRWWIVVVIVLVGLTLSFFVPEGSHECVLYEEVICLEGAQDLPDDEAAHRALYRFVSAEHGVAVPGLDAFLNEDEAEYVLSVADGTYTFANRAASPQWSVTPEKLSIDKWRVVQHSRFITETD